MQQRTLGKYWKVAMIKTHRHTEEVLYPLIDRLTEIRNYTEILEKQYEDVIADIHPYHKNSARNLIHYLAIRTFDLCNIQEHLSSLGLSSLDHSEGYTLTNLNNILWLLSLICEKPQPAPTDGFSMDFSKSRRRLQEHADEIFGDRSSTHTTRIMVTMPSEAATDKKLINKLLENGMNCARINCGHDTPDIWMKIIENVRKISEKKGIPCKIYMDLAGPKLRTGAVEKLSERKHVYKNKKSKKGGKKKSHKKINEVHLKRLRALNRKKSKKGILLFQGDILNVYRDHRIGKRAVFSKKGRLKKSASISTTLPTIFRDIHADERIWFNDGKIGGTITQLFEDHFEVTITDASDKGSFLLAGQGINLPDTELSLPSLTAEDLKLLPLVLEHADILGYSFVRKPEDVVQLQHSLKELGREDISIILKIETWDAFHNLPDILLAAMKSPKVGVMIARGDLAVEVGWRRMSELQEEILWLCEAAHIPTIWATQILENLAKKGLATRSEITDAAMASRAECAMLNKGPHIVKAVSTLREIMDRMKAHQRKKMDTLSPLGVAIDFITRGAQENTQNSLVSQA